MTNKIEIIARLKKENPKAHEIVNGEQTEITGADYEALIDRWATAEIEKLAAEQKLATDKATAEAKLAAIGLTVDDLKALGF